MAGSRTSHVAVVTLLPLGLLFTLLAVQPAVALRLKDKQNKTEEAMQAQAEAAASEAVEEAKKADAAEAAGPVTPAVVTQDDLLEVTADASVAALHMVLHNLPPGPAPIKVDTVDSGEWAEKAGIEPGSEIVTVNGKIAKDFTMKEFINTLKARPVKLTIRAPLAQDSSAAATQQATNIAATQQASASAAHAPAPAAPDGLQDLRKHLSEAAHEAARQAGHEAGTAAARALVDDLKKILGVDNKTEAEKLKETLKKVVEPKAAPAPAPVAVGIAAPAPFLAPQPPAVPLPAAPAPTQPCHQVANVTQRQPNAGPPEPVPPSPLDALKAAMAIRANLTAGRAPLLPPDVLNRVADMARQQFGDFIPHGLPGVHPPPCKTPPAGAPAAAPGPAPVGAPAAAAAGAVVEKVEVEMTVKNVSFTALQASPSLMAQFEQNARVTFGESAGVDPAGVEVELEGGSVVVKGKITPPPGKSAADLDKNIEAGAANVGARMVARTKTLPGIDSVALGDISATQIKVAVVATVAPIIVTTTPPPPTRHLPKPPKCASAPPKMTSGEARMSLAPFKPPGAQGKGIKTEDGGTAWPTEDGGWAFQYPDMALRMATDGTTRIVWNKPAYAVEYDETGISYHVGQNVVHRDVNGDLTYQQPTGTMHQEGSTLVYHWCNPNVIVYQTPDGFVYYDDMGMTYRSMGKDVTHYTWSGQVLYQGAGGVTRQDPDGQVTHWTDAGAVYRHPDGSVSYTPVGESTSSALAVSDLGADPFPGAPLTTEDVMRLSAPNSTALGALSAKVANGTGVPKQLVAAAR